MLKHKQKGFIITYILVFAVIFAILLTALLGFILSQMRASKHEVASEQALYIAEAGLNRYRWYLIHQSQQLLSGDELGCPPSDCLECGECEYEFNLPGVGVIGGYSLIVEEVRPCGITTAVTVIAEAWTNDFPNSKRKVKLRYIKPSVADYSYILNHNVWAGSDRVIAGPYHSNGGIRMDGENNSLVSSEQSEWICTTSYGCSPCPSECNYILDRGCVCPGVFTTANGQDDLFVTDANHFDFEGITVNLNQIKGFTKEEDKGLYLPPSEELGYHVILNNRQLIVKKILELSRVRAYNEEMGDFWEYSIISEESVPEYYTLGDCGLVFIEDDIWIEGELSGKLTLISADLIDEEKETNVWLKGNIEYFNGIGADGLVLVGQHNVLITPDSPDYMDLYGVFIAQNGHFGRNHYSLWQYSRYAKKEELTVYGSIVSNGRVGTQWTSGGSWVSGYRVRYNIYDSKLSIDPPPFLPCLTEEFGFREWHEIQ